MPSIWAARMGENMIFNIVSISEMYRASVDKYVAEGWAGPYVVTKGVLHDTRNHFGFVAEKNCEILGYILYNIANENLEITVLESLCEKQGVGRALVNAVVKEAKSTGCSCVWLITTNDNTHAIRFYQRIGFTLRAVYIDAIEESRKLKPQIPLTGHDSIPIEHEFEFQMLC